MKHDLACIAASIVYHKNTRERVSALIDSPGDLSKKTILALHTEFARLTKFIENLKAEKRKLKGCKIETS